MALGTLHLVELSGCPFAWLNDAEALEHQLRAALTEAGATCRQTLFHHFTPQGVTGLVVLQESHCALHTWPELGLATIDVFTCGSAFRPADFVRVLERLLPSAEVRLQSISRG